MVATDTCPFRNHAGAERDANIKRGWKTPFLKYNIINVQ